MELERKTWKESVDFLKGFSNESSQKSKKEQIEESNSRTIIRSTSPDNNKLIPFAL